MRTGAETTELPIELEKLIHDAVREILRHEDRLKFMSWLKKHLSDYFKDQKSMLRDLQAMTGMATLLGVTIWDAMPLPGNGFRPKPIPKPQFVDPCPCGSGRTFESCCFFDEKIHFPELDPSALWPFVIEALPKTTIKKLIIERRFPIGALLTLAVEYEAENKPRKALNLLEPLFDEKLEDTGAEAGHALDMVFSLYDELGYWNKKEKLLDFVLATAKPSPLRSVAFQRHAAAMMDIDEPEKAWGSFLAGQRDNPTDPSLGPLEVQLLMAEGKYKLARERARFWFKKLDRLGDDQHTLIMDFLSSVVKDPQNAFDDLMFNAFGGAGLGLRDWLDTVIDRPVPLYGLERIKDHGADNWDTAGKDGVAKQNFDSNAFWKSTDAGMTLVAPRKVQVLEAKWRDVYPCEKPFSIYDEPFDRLDPWSVETQLAWTEFLEENPSAYDSINILDDLATALLFKMDEEFAWFGKGLLEIILKRVAAIVEQVCPANGSIHLNWIDTENRPALRSLVRLAWYYTENGYQEESIQLMERLLSLNPMDNHGFRASLINCYLERGDDEKALALAEQFQGDMLAETVFGEILALYRLNRLGEAAEALVNSGKRMKKVVRYLIRSRVKKPKMDEQGITIGGDDQAWLYRETMRKTWQAVHGALDWLKKNTAGW